MLPCRGKGSKFRYQRTVATNFCPQRLILHQIPGTQTAAQHRNGGAAGQHRALMGGTVDSQRAAADHKGSGACHALSHNVAHLHRISGRLAGTHNAQGQLPVPVRHGAVHIQHQRRVRQIPQQAGIIRMVIVEYLPALLLAGGKHFVRSGQRRALQVLHLIFCQRRGHAPLHNVGVVHRLGAAEFF